MNYLSSLSEASLLIILLIASIALSLVCFFLIQKYCTWLSLGDDGIFGTIFANTMPTLVGFVFAFVTVAAWQNYNSVSDTVSKEAHFYILQPPLIISSSSGTGFFKESGSIKSNRPSLFTEA